MAQEQIGMKDGQNFFVGNNDPAPAATAPVTRYTTAPAPTADPSTPPPIYSNTQPTAAPTLGAVDENAIREQTRQRMQSSIDAINANYTNLISQEKVNGQDRSGQTRAVNARSGLMGSDFGTANDTKTTQFNQSQEKALVDAQNAQINSVMQNIEDRASAEIQNKKQEALGKYNMDMTAFKDAQESARGDLKTLAGKGVDLNTLNPDQKAALLKQAGYDGQFGELIYNAMKPKPQQIDYKFEKLADGQGMFYGTDPATGQLVTQKVSVDLPPNWDMTIAPDGTVIGFDKNSGESRVLSDKGQFAKPDTSSADNGFTLGKDQTRYDAQGNVIAGANAPDNGASNEQALSVAQTNISTINDLLSKQNFANAAAPSALGRLNLANGITGAKDKVIADIEQVSSQLTLDKLIQAKANGATFGALSDSELHLLASSASKIGQWAIKDKNGKVTGYQVNEKDLRKELNIINNFAKQDYLLKRGKPEDIGATQMPDGSVWVNNPDGSKSKLVDKLPADPNAGKPYLPPSFHPAGNASASTTGNQVKSYRVTADKEKFINMDTIPELSGNSKALASSAINKYPPGTKGPGVGQYEGQCGVFVRSIAESYGLTYAKLGDTLGSKMAAVANHGTTDISKAHLGSVIVTKENPKSGHVAWIIGKNAQGFIVAESNFKQSKTISYGRVIPFNSNKIIGIINPTKA